MIFVLISLLAESKYENQLPTSAREDMSREMSDSVRGENLENFALITDASVCFPDKWNKRDALSVI